MAMRWSTVGFPPNERRVLLHNEGSDRGAAVVHSNEHGGGYVVHYSPSGSHLTQWEKFGPYPTLEEAEAVSTALVGVAA